MKRNSLIDYVKGVLICLVCVGHTIEYVIYQRGEGYWTDAVFKGIYMFHMPFFMGISGYLSYSGIQKTSLIKFLINKFRAYLIPILAWAVIFRLSIFLVSRKTVFFDLPYLIFKEFYSSLWFLWVLLGCLIITAGIKSIGKGFNYLYPLSFFAMLLLPETGHIVLLKFMFPFFQSGYVLASLGEINLNRSKKNLIFYSSALISILCYVLWNKDSYIYITGTVIEFNNFQNIGIRYLAGFSASIFIFYILTETYKALNLNFSNFVSQLGRDSILIYIIQGYLFILISNIPKNLFPPLDDLMFKHVLSLIIGFLIAVLSWSVGRLIIKNEILSEMLFGKLNRILTKE